VAEDGKRHQRIREGTSRQRMERGASRKTERSRKQRYTKGGVVGGGLEVEEVMAEVRNIAIVALERRWQGQRASLRRQAVDATARRFDQLRAPARAFLRVLLISSGRLMRTKVLLIRTVIGFTA